MVTAVPGVGGAAAPQGVGPGEEETEASAGTYGVQPVRPAGRRRPPR